MRHYAKFTYPIDCRYTEAPGGRELAELLADSFGKLGFDVIGVDNFRDFAWSADLRVDGHVINVVAGAYDEQDSWMVQVVYTTSFFSRLRRGIPTEQQKTITLALHDILSGIAGVSDLRWEHAGNVGKPADHANG